MTLTELQLEVNELINAVYIPARGRIIEQERANGNETLPAEYISFVTNLHMDNVDHDVMAGQVQQPQTHEEYIDLIAAEHQKSLTAEV